MGLLGIEKGDCVDKKRRILLILVILTLAFIFGQSLLDEAVSSKISTDVSYKVVKPVYKAITGTRNLPFDIRDFAHVVEFSVLGFELQLLARNKKKALSLIKTVSYCGFVALIDESIQFFSDRSPQVKDIWFDTLGAAVGALFGFLIVLLIERERAKKLKVET